jgi:NAD(P)-dependent dehydrogenase (short-subunit alcohol dehydrogenase family)
VALLDVQGEAARAAAKDLEAKGGLVMGLEVDVRDRAAVESAMEAVRSMFGPVGIAVTSAGVDADGAFTDITPHTWERILAIT